MQFDIARYQSLVRPVDVSDIDLDDFRRQPLDADSLRCLRYMHDVEYHTVCYLRDLLVTSAHADPEITTFLTFWAYEEFWHGEAIASVLAAHGEPAGAARVGELRAGRRARDRVSPIVSTTASALLGRRMPAVHMAWGAINEWTTQAGYARLAQRSDHPTLQTLLRRIMTQEGRHIDFYASQAQRRLDGDRRSQAVCRFALAHFWRPVGSGVVASSETDFLVRHLFGGSEGLAVADRIDRRIDRLPGLSGLGLARHAVLVVEPEAATRSARSARSTPPTEIATGAFSDRRVARAA